LGTNGVVGKNAAWEKNLSQPASAMIRASLRTAFKRKFPNLSLSEINMKILDYLTFMDEKYGHA
jgi:hypothetical protein